MTETIRTDMKEMPRSIEETCESALWSMLTGVKECVVPLINRLFHTEFTENAAVTFLHKKHTLRRFGGLPTGREGDMVLEVSECLPAPVRRYYTVVCEVWRDRSVFLRILEFDSVSDIETVHCYEDSIVVDEPNCACIFLCTPQVKLPEKIEVRLMMPNREVFSLWAFQIQVSEHSPEELLRCKLLSLLPFCMFTFLDELENPDTDDSLREAFVSILTEVTLELEKMHGTGQLSAYGFRHTLEVLQYVTQWLVEDDEDLSKEVADIMRTAIYKTDAQKLFELGVKDGERKGRIEGKNEGKIEGKNEGMTESAALFEYLLSGGRTEDALKAARDMQYMNQLMEEFKKGSLHAE